MRCFVARDVLLTAAGMVCVGVSVGVGVGVGVIVGIPLPYLCKVNPMLYPDQRYTLT